MIPLIDTHSHLLNLQNFPERIIFKRMNIDKGYIEPLIEALGDNRSLLKIAEKALDIFGNKYRLVQTLELFDSNFDETVEEAIIDMDKAGIDYAVPLMIDLDTPFTNNDFPFKLMLKKYRELDTSRFLPFIGVDPRREDIVDILQKEDFYFGIKMYPALGFSPNPNDKYNSPETNRRLRQIYELCVYHNIPVVLHCSKGGIMGDVLKESTAHYLSSPERIFDVCYEYPHLKVVLAHGGGEDSFMGFYNEGKDGWTKTINMYQKERPNLGIDLSCHRAAVFFPEKFFNAVRSCLEDPFASTNIYFGSDWAIHNIEYSRYKLVKRFVDNLVPNNWKFLKQNNCNLLGF